jgi:uncharacterized delta-60 repeat protein
MMRRSLVAVLTLAGLAALQLTGVAAGAGSGSLDPTFSADGIAFLNQTAYAVAIQADGKIVVAGGATTPDGKGGFGLTRYNPDGTLDPSFSGNGLVRTPFLKGGYAEAVAIQPNGRIVVGGRAETRTNREAFALARYLPDGSLDTSFSRNGKRAAPTIGSWNASEISDIALGPGNAIVASTYLDDGHDYVFGVIRLTRQGRPDPAFSGDGVAATRFSPYPGGFAQSIAIQPDGSIVAVGSVRTSGNYPGGFAVARYLSSGKHDDSFDSDGKRTIGFGGTWSGASDVALQPDGRIVISGTGHYGPKLQYGQLRMDVARINTDGTLDPSFAGDGKRTTALDGNLRGSSLAIGSDGKIVVGGEATPTLDEYPTNFAVVRYTTHGRLDASFSGNGIMVRSVRLDDWIEDVALQPDGRIVAVGASQGRPPRGYAVARFLP